MSEESGSGDDGDDEELAAPLALAIDVNEAEETAQSPQTPDPATH
jgi:exoribonuclease-2